jgi:hypothetical protein
MAISHFFLAHLYYLENKFEDAMNYLQEVVKVTEA